MRIIYPHKTYDSILGLRNAAQGLFKNSQLIFLQQRVSKYKVRALIDWGHGPLPRDQEDCGGRSSAVEPSVVVRAVVGSNPIGRPKSLMCRSATDMVL
jgi:hypothetical protein